MGLYTVVIWVVTFVVCSYLIIQYYNAKAYIMHYCEISYDLITCLVYQGQRQMWRIMF